MKSTYLKYKYFIFNLYVICIRKQYAFDNNNSIVKTRETFF